jgi:hypothetical protein
MSTFEERIKALAEKANKSLAKKREREAKKSPAVTPKVIRRQWQPFSVWTKGHHIDYIEDYTLAAALKRAREMYVPHDGLYVSDENGNYHPADIAAKYPEPVPLKQVWMAYNHNDVALMNEPGSREEAQQEADAYSHATGNASRISSSIISG